VIDIGHTVGRKSERRADQAGDRPGWATSPCPHCNGTGWIADPDAMLAIAVIDQVGVAIAFSAAELRHHARTINGPLRAAVGAKSARQVGRALHRVSGRTINGCRIERVGRDNDGTLWTVQVGGTTYTDPVDGGRLQVSPCARRNRERRT
jgi:hypothetical protein